MSDKPIEDRAAAPKKPSNEVGVGATQLRHNVASVLDETAEIERIFPEDLRDIALTLRHLDAPGYRFLMRYLKGQMTAAQIFSMDPRNDSACSVLDALRKFKESHSAWQDEEDEDDRWGMDYDKREERNKQKQLKFNMEIMRLTRTECPGMAINIRNPMEIPAEPNGYDASVTLTIIVSGGTGDENTVTVTCESGVSILSAANGQKAILRDGERAVVGRAGLTLKEILGVPLKEKRSVPVALSFGNNCVSRAGLTLQRSTDGKTITVFDSGMFWEVTVVDGSKQIKYDPAIMRSYVSQQEQD